MPPGQLWTSMDEAVRVSPWIALPGGRHNLGIGRHWHFFAVAFWVLNGLVYVAFLFGADAWRRLIPTSWDIFPAAWHAFLSYATFHLPSAGSWHPYNPLQLLAYASVVFICAFVDPHRGCHVAGGGCAVSLVSTAVREPAECPELALPGHGRLPGLHPDPRRPGGRRGFPAKDGSNRSGIGAAARRPGGVPGIGSHRRGGRPSRAPHRVVAATPASVQRFSGSAHRWVDPPPALSTDQPAGGPPGGYLALLLGERKERRSTRSGANWRRTDLPAGSCR